jgi:hypothetical protein
MHKVNDDDPRRSEEMGRTRRPGRRDGDGNGDGDGWGPGRGTEAGGRTRGYHADEAGDEEHDRERGEWDAARSGSHEFTPSTPQLLELEMRVEEGVYAGCTSESDRLGPIP